MKLLTVISALETARKKFIDKHGKEPHLAPSVSGDFGLCVNVGETTDGLPRYTRPIEPVSCKSIVKFAEFVRGPGQ